MFKPPGFARETIPQRIRRVCVKPKDGDSGSLRSSLFPFGAMFWVMVVAMIGSIVALCCTELFHHYADLLIRLSRGL